MSRAFGLLLLLLLLSGCGAKFAYNNLSIISPWYVDDYIDLSAEQKEIFDRHLQQLQQWHRETELPQYRRLLSDLHTHLQAAELDPELLSHKIGRLRGHWDALISQSTPAIVELSSTLSEQQLGQFFEALEARNEKRLKRADTPSEHRKETLEWIEKWMGELKRDQRQLIENYAQLNPDLTEQTVAAHRAFQAQLKTLLDQPNQLSFEAKLSKLVQDPLGESVAGRQLNALREQQLKARVELFQQLWRSATDNQKRKVRSRLQGYIDDIDDLLKG